MDEKILVFDLECACWMGSPPGGMRADIIEIGLCVLDMSITGVTERKSIMIKPANAVIGAFCTELTGITQEMVDSDGVSFKEAIAIMKEHMQGTTSSAAWGKFDARALRMDCAHYGVEYPLIKHSNAQGVFKNKMGLKQETSVVKALEHFGKAFDGRQHRAMDDAYNTAIILSEILCGALEKRHGSR